MSVLYSISQYTNKAIITKSEIYVCFLGELQIYNINQAKIRFLTHADDDFYLFDGPYDFQFSRGMEVVALLS